MSAVRARHGPSCASSIASSASSRARRPQTTSACSTAWRTIGGDLGLVGDREPRVEVGLERELAQQREAEGVDGADGDLAQPVAQGAPARAAVAGARRLGAQAAR